MNYSTLTIGGSDSGGGAGIQADIKTFSALNVHGCSVITAITAQNTLGVSSVFGIPIENVMDQFEAVLSDFKIKWAKTGMLFSTKTVAAIARRLSKTDISLVLDPVMEAEAGGRLLSVDSLQTLKEDLIPIAFVVTPNIYEAEAITGIRIRDLDDALKAGKSILDLGAKAALITGGHLDYTDLLVLDGDVIKITGQQMTGGNHGVGCTYSAALTAFMCRGDTLKDAAIKAKGFAESSIIGSVQVGKGASPVNQSYIFLREADRFRVRNDVEVAVSSLLNHPAFYKLIPEVGCNICMALEGAVTPDDAAAVEGRIVRSRTRAIKCGNVRFGASDHVARIVLTAMSFNKSFRAAMNIKMKDDLISTALKLGMSTGSFSRLDEPPHASTMSFGTARAIEESGKVPDLIWDAGGHGKEPMIRLLGQSATQVAANALKLAESYHTRDRKI